MDNAHAQLDNGNAAVAKGSRKKTPATKEERQWRGGRSSRLCPLHGCWKRATTKVKSGTFNGLVCKEHARWLRECERTFHSTRRLLRLKYGGGFFRGHSDSKRHEVLHEQVGTIAQFTKHQLLEAA